MNKPTSEQRIAQLEARVAVLQQALKSVEYVWMLKELGPDGTLTEVEVCRSCESEKGVDKHQPDCAIAKALSSVPEILYQCKAKWDTAYLLYPVVRIPTRPSPFTEIWFSCEENFDEWPGEPAEIVVFANKQEEA